MNQVVSKRRRIGCDAAGTPLPGKVNAERRFHMAFKAEEDDIDELGHVNNATRVVWIQDASVAHWLAAARSGDRDCFVTAVLRHEVDYRGNIRAGDEAIAVTWVDGAPRGARYALRVEFTGADGKVLVASRSEWPLIDRLTGKSARVSAEIAAPFLKTDEF
ncbi:acyl-CoA thioesterase [Microvirga sp. Mcv34]|nr:acyl-CoA thioesterase [Microvirga sp. Mcv34]